LFEISSSFNFLNVVEYSRTYESHYLNEIKMDGKPMLKSIKLSLCACVFFGMSATALAADSTAPNPFTPSVATQANVSAPVLTRRTTKAPTIRVVRKAVVKPIGQKAAMNSDRAVIIARDTTSRTKIIRHNARINTTMPNLYK